MADETEITNKTKELTISDDSEIITLLSNDGKEFKLTSSAAAFSETIKNMIEDGCASSTIPLPLVDGQTLSKVVGYLSEKSDQETKSMTKDERKKFEDEFASSEEMSGLFDLILAANYLNIEDLMKGVATKIATKMENKSVKWVRKTFGLENDMTPEEEQRIHDEYPWAWEGVDPDTDDEIEVQAVAQT